MNDRPPGICPLCGTEVAKWHRIAASRAQYGCRGCGIKLLSQTGSYLLSKSFLLPLFVGTAIITAFFFDMIPKRSRLDFIFGWLFLNFAFLFNHNLKTAIYIVGPGSRK